MSVYFDKPAVLRLVPGLNDDEPIIAVFDSEDDAVKYWKADDVFNDEYDGFNYIYPAGAAIDIHYAENVSVYHVSHEQLQRHLDLLYKSWCESNNRRIEYEEYQQDILDAQYYKWETLFNREV